MKTRRNKKQINIRVIQKIKNRSSNNTINNIVSLIKVDNLKRATNTLKVQYLKIDKVLYKILN